MAKARCVAWVLSCSFLILGIVDAETMNHSQSVAITKESLAQMSEDSTVCAIKRLDGKYILANKEDTKIIEKRLKEYENEWLDDAEFAQAKSDNGYWMGAGILGRKVWEKSQGRLYFYKDGAKIYDLSLIDLGLCMDQGGDDDHRYLWLHWDEPLSQAISKIMSPTYTSQTDVCERAEKTSTSSDSRSVREDYKRYDKKKLEKGICAREYRFDKFLLKHFGKISVTLSPIFYMDEYDMASIKSDHTQEGDSIFMHLKPENLKKLREWFNKIESDGIFIPKEFKTELENAEKLEREAKSLVVCTVGGHNGEYVYVKGEDAKFIEKGLNEFGEKWLKSDEFARIMKKIGYRLLSEAEKRDLREKGKNSQEQLFIHKNRVKTHVVIF